MGSKADSSLFIYSNKSVTMYLLIYVDDIIIIASVPTTITELLQLLSVDFVVKDLGDLHYFLGVEVLLVKTSLILSQRRYILDLLKKTHPSGHPPRFYWPSLVIQWTILLYITTLLAPYNTYQ